jgi:hypothetical protein
MKAPMFTAFAKALGVAFTAAQLVCYRVMFDGVDPVALEPGERTIAAQLFGDAGVVPPLARETAVFVKGARIGGTRFGALRLLQLALTVDLSTLAPGEIASALIVAPDQRLARQGFRYALGAIRADASLRKRIVDKPTKDAVTLKRPDGKLVTIETLPATRGGTSLRARSLVGVLFSEAAFFRDENYEVNDAELFRAVAPRLLPGGQIIIESTPWAEAGLLHELFEKNHGAPTTALAAHCPTLVMRGDDERLQRIVAAEYERDEENAEREFGARFLSAGTSLFFDPKAIDACVVDYELPLPPVAWRDHSHAGADTGFTSDSSAIAVVGRRENSVCVVALDEVRPEKGKPLKPSAVVRGWAASASVYACPFVVADGHYRESVREYLNEAGLELRDAPAGQGGKASSYVELRKMINEGRITLPKHARLLAQLKKVTAKPQPGGGLKISSPRSRTGHGDLVSALVLAVWAHQGHDVEDDCELLVVSRGTGRGVHFTDSSRSTEEIQKRDPLLREAILARYRKQGIA